MLFSRAFALCLAFFDSVSCTLEWNMPMEQMDPMEQQQSHREGTRCARSIPEGDGKGLHIYHMRHERSADDRHPYCVVWTYLPCLTTIIPLIGHVGICTAEGVVHDFAGPYFISVDRMAFNRPMRVWRLDRGGVNHPEDPMMYDRAIEAADAQFCRMSHNLICNNCHHHVADALNHMAYKGRRNWTQFDVWWQLVVRGRFLTWRDCFVVWSAWTILGIIVIFCRFVLPHLS
ncbi:transmembrane protein TMEM222 [Toxoplasma gondii ME49]|uniref:Transmembrane protein n=5 Tax=Toxoplasma gondii TaxID=5811 RepID=A0A125YYH9_TOXGV|nr:transmembrane protein TMEM222 [Toxoplasma gondii ME49]EPT29006.1 transmembrane protein TMEM222 [Toxoplasma gondii ME49]ESS35630.1 transmembrane protein [Toxoplasma gondii VEG]KYF46024.1 transmembrane protein TMEM222 [Toxoplasma gondii ARI]PIM03324.1 transmembrane protein TMEM222 [Toxoplasma gondii COUG]|eukprot:XP_018636876.1 transmembrane protein TMEM222 [Toxoplasma gondii ME49]